MSKKISFLKCAFFHDSVDVFLNPKVDFNRFYIRINFVFEKLAVRIFQLIWFHKNETKHLGMFISRNLYHLQCLYLNLFLIYFLTDDSHYFTYGLIYIMAQFQKFNPLGSKFTILRDALITYQVFFPHQEWFYINHQINSNREN